MYIQGGRYMKTEIINVRVDEKTKSKLLEKSKYYNNTLSGFMLDTAEKACNLDVVQLWIHAYIDFTIKRNRVDNGCVITHNKSKDGEYWNVPPLKSTYVTRVALLDALRNDIDTFLPRMCDVLDNWSEFVRRLKLLGMWKEAE